MGQRHCFLSSCYLSLIKKHNSGTDSNGGIIPLLDLMKAPVLQREERHRNRYMILVQKVAG